jgi:hypothetical protein
VNDDAPPLIRALDGDEDAVEQVLGSVCAPLFDLSLHIHREPVRAELLTVVALRKLASDIRSAAITPDKDPLVVGARHLLASPDNEPAPPPGTELQRRLLALDRLQRRAVLAAFALDLDPAELGDALEVTPPQAESLIQDALRRLDLQPDEIRDALDTVAAQVPLPRELVDRAL